MSTDALDPIPAAVKRALGEVGELKELLIAHKGLLTESLQWGSPDAWYFRREVWQEQHRLFCRARTEALTRWWAPYRLQGHTMRTVRSGSQQIRARWDKMGMFLWQERTNRAVSSAQADPMFRTLYGYLVTDRMFTRLDSFSRCGLAEAFLRREERRCRLPEGEYMFVGDPVWSELGGTLIHTFLEHPRCFGYRARFAW